MKITMIGHSRSGKTSYMAGLYHLYGNSKDGFGLRVYDSSKESNLVQLGNKVANGQYPSGTDIATNYTFWLTFQGRDLLHFDWYDYRGGALMESSKNSKDAQNLVERINTSDALMVFLDGEKIVNMSDDDLEDEYDVLLWAIQKSISYRVSQDHYFPISFVITKGDLYDSYSPLYSSPGLEYFMPVIHTVKESSVAAGMIGIIEVCRNSIFNVFSPLCFSLYYGLHHYQEEAANNVNMYVRLIKGLDTSPWNDLKTWWNGEKSSSQKAQEYYKSGTYWENQLEMYKSLSKGLENHLKSYREKNMIIQF